MKHESYESHATEREAIEADAKELKDDEVARGAAAGLAARTLEEHRAGDVELAAPALEELRAAAAGGPSRWKPAGVRESDGRPHPAGVWPGTPPPRPGVRVCDPIIGIATAAAPVRRRKSDGRFYSRSASGTEVADEEFEDYVEPEAVAEERGRPAQG